ncbi:metal ABC transporter ATP-binding protein [Entomospira culicis]|uniref:Metal ABC transporter ATP-binding protein n=1 Tax=Entomospira culicis TaxID=2719989 RepID=A0A968GGY2_9SPIO|nr:metal ABC transporter ATP-binding protein [Entomospira culicis]NIZ18589.1 metal ABC transporter ATP-binding protein [Entomospira culicis]NIZ68804.1 metal ABC transporter ATP-binding protein [Entomospira culicis]WDI37399.1 metal ABC transporter ATP-binding protein [Entomospira culicis]WDI39028.1 metal ABC transporter ATP-binding protein [Entomospira culicis]
MSDPNTCPNAIIELKNVGLAYSASIQALHDINLCLHQGDYLCLLGNNGAGKSSLVKIIVGLLCPTQGSVHYYIDRYAISYLPQESYHLPSMPASVWEVVLSGSQHKQHAFFYSKEIKEYARKLLIDLDLLHLQHRSMSQLSGGQKRRILLARSLISKPKLLILDEPNAGLDQQATADLYQLLANLNEQGLSILMVSHDQDAVKKYAKNVVMIDKTIQFWGSKHFWHLNQGDKP